MLATLQSDWMSCVQRDSGLFSWSRTLSRERSGARRRACPTHRRRFWRNSADSDGRGGFQSPCSNECWGRLLEVLFYIIQLTQFVVSLQGLFAIVEFENEDSAQKVLTHDEDILLSSCRLVVKPRLLRQQVAALGDNRDNNDSNAADQSDADPHSQLMEKLASCGSVCVSPFHLMLGM